MRLIKHDIRYDNIAYWPSNIKASILFIIAILLLVTLYFFIIKPQLNILLQTKKQESRLEILSKEIAQLISQLTTYQKRIKILKTESEFFKEKLYNESRNSFIDLLGHLLKLSGLRLLLLQPIKSKINRFYITMPLRIKVSGKFQQIIIFMSQLIKHKIMF